MDGVLIINKPKGYTSHDVVNIVRKELNMKKVGHTGTLDPNATGVLPILIGQATKISKYLIEHNKTYVAILKLGEKTETGDSEGNIIEVDNKLQDFTVQDIEKALETFKGKQKQVPPIYSAIKINGKKAYEYAREGEQIELEAREIEIFDIKLIEYTNQRIKFQVTCSKGTYIRTLCQDIAVKLGTIGHMEELERVTVNEFSIKDAISIEEIKEKTAKNIITIEKVFENNNKINLRCEEKKKYLNGVKLEYNLPNGVYRVYTETEFVGLGTIENKLLKRDLCV